jgi:deoxyribonuclease-4
MASLRVRSLLSALTSAEKTAFKKLLPPELLKDVPAVETHRYPASLLSILPKEESYSLLGCITEDLLRLPAAEIVLEALFTAIRKWVPTIPPESLAKLTKSKTTDPYLEHVRATRGAWESVIKGGSLRFDTEIVAETIQGHPDAQTDTQIFEVKTTGLLAKNWVDFLFQVFAYAAIDLTATDLYLVLPLQRTVWGFTLSAWTKRAELRAFLIAAARKRLDASVDKSPLPGLALQLHFQIGSHIHKGRSLSETISLLPAGKPYQLFLGGPMNTKLAIKDADLAAANAALVASGSHLYVHSPYLINLCSEPGEKDDYGVNCLIKNLQYASVIGCRGVVVHVGKSVGREAGLALSNMRVNLLTAMEHATAACPILLETPAGQGTEMLTKYADFVDFVRTFESDRIAICVDTCHVFAAGCDPLTYITDLLASATPALLKLVHFNDSSGCCGSCVDRHAFIGTGEIGLEKLAAIAERCSSCRVPMLVE